VAELGRRLGHGHAELAAALARLVEAGDVIGTDGTKAGGKTGGKDGGLDWERAVFVHAEPFARLEKQTLDTLAAFHKEHPHKPGMSRQELRARLPQALPGRMYDELVATLVRRGAAVAEADWVRRAQAARPSARLSPLEQKLATAFADWGLTPPRPKTLPAEVGADAKAVRVATERLISLGHLVKVKSDLFVDAGAIARLQASLEAHLDAHGQITPAEWKAITGTSRKFSIPLAEHFDAIKLTLRVGDIRKRRG
jgi:selenocysteine-specific elongation factor